MPEIAILAAPNVSAASLFGAAEMFAAANRVILSTAQPTGLFNVSLCSMSGAPVMTSGGVVISIPTALENLQHADLLYIAPPSIHSKSELGQQTQAWAKVVAWLQSEHERYSCIASHCCGSFILAQSGLLGGGQATSAWWLNNVLAAEHPDIAVDPDAIVVRSDRYVTAAGTSAYQDLIIEFIREFAGPSVSRLTAKYWMTDRQRRSQSAYRLAADSGPGQDELAEQARRWIKKHLSTNFKIDDLAHALNTTPRTLLRRMQEHTGDSVQSLIQKIRIEHSKVLLETTDLKLQSIARRCGYLDESAFRRVFKRHCGMSAREFRLRFNAKRDYVD